MFAVRVKIKIELNCIDPAPQLDKTSQYHCWVLHGKFLRKNASFQILPTTFLASENFDDPVYTVNQIFKKVFTTADQITR